MNNQFIMINANAYKCLDNPFEQAIFLAIKSYFPNAFPSLELIAKKSNLCRSTVMKYMKRLVSKGILQVFKYNGRVNRYAFNPEFLTIKEAEKQAKVHKEKYIRLVGGIAKMVGSFFAKKKPVQRSVNNNAQTSIVTHPLSRNTYISREIYKEDDCIKITKDMMRDYVSACNGL